MALLFLIATALIQCNPPRETEDVLLFYLGGQSNMEGFGYNRELSEEMDGEFENVFIFHGNPAVDKESDGGPGVWKKLRPGHGVGFVSDGKKNTYSYRFGVELSFAVRLMELYPGKKIALIKYAVGGTSIDSTASSAGCWDPDFSHTNQYDNFLTTVSNALDVKDIDKNGKPDHLIAAGIIWMQGESDAGGKEHAATNYHHQLKRLMQLQRAAFHDNELPVVIGKITDSGKNETGKVWEYLETVQKAQEDFVSHDRNAIMVRSTENYDYSDPWHYDSEGYLDLGEKFADAVYQLNNR